MRIYDEGNRLAGMQCNCCKKVLQIENGIVKEGCFSVDYTWGYFSNKDGMCHKLDLCEECYDRLIGELKIPVTETENSELL